jgi:hypothetical protein
MWFTIYFLVNTSLTGGVELWIPGDTVAPDGWSSRYYETGCESRAKRANEWIRNDPSTRGLMKAECQPSKIR